VRTKSGFALAYEGRTLNVPENCETICAALCLFCRAKGFDLLLAGQAYNFAQESVWRRLFMRKHKILYLLLFVCIAGLALAQKKPREVQRQAPQGASVEQNKATARRVFEELFTQGRYGEVNQIYAQNCRFQFGGRSEGLSQAVAEGRGWKSAAPDLVMTANQITANGDEVTVNWTAHGTHTGQGHGLKPTGKHVNMRGRTTFRFANGKIVEANSDDYQPELFRQLGVSKTTASMVDSTQRVWAALAQIFPDPLYASLR